MEEILSTVLDENIATLNSIFPIGRCFDFVTQKVSFAKKQGFFLGINGFYDTDTLQKIFADLKDNPIPSKAGYAQITLCDNWDTIVTAVLSGICLLLLEDTSQAMLIDVRTYPDRSIEEPDTEKITRGAKDSFVETLTTNINLIRRHVRSVELIFENFHLGSKSRTDISICYLNSTVNNDLLKELRANLESLKITSLTSGEKSLEELLIPKRWYNPMPDILTTERPDVATSYLTEGYILVLVDNSPLVMVLPCTIFQFTQSPEDYRRNPAAGTYFRLVRFFCIPVSLLLMPTFMLITAFFPDISGKWQLMSTGDLSAGRIIFYIFAVEFLLDLFQYSGAMSSSKFSPSLSIVGGLIIGDMAVSLNWASMEVLFYGAITMLASLSIYHIALAEALRVYRIFLLIITAILGPIGYAAGILLILISIATTPTFGKMSYFWPLFPFNWSALKTLLFRSPTYKAQPSKIWRR